MSRRGGGRGRGRGWLGAVVVVMALRSVSRGAANKLREDETGVTAKTGPLLRNGSSSDRTGRMGWGWGGGRGR